MLSTRWLYGAPEHTVSGEDIVVEHAAEVVQHVDASQHLQPPVCPTESQLVLQQKKLGGRLAHTHHTM